MYKYLKAGTTLSELLISIVLASVFCSFVTDKVLIVHHLLLCLVELRLAVVLVVPGWQEESVGG